VVDFGVVEVLIVVFFVLFVFLFIGVVLFMAIAATRSKRALEAGGLDPLAAEAQLAARAANSQLLAPRRSLEDRLAELDDLRSRGVISEDEHATARAKALAEG
jgi:cell division protein FtsB